jgi:hypothetical protein
MRNVETCKGKSQGTNVYFQILTSVADSPRDSLKHKARPPRLTQGRESFIFVSQNLENISDMQWKIGSKKLFVKLIC